MRPISSAVVKARCLLTSRKRLNFLTVCKIAVSEPLRTAQVPDGPSGHRSGSSRSTPPRRGCRPWARRSRLVRTEVASGLAILDPLPRLLVPAGDIDNVDVRGRDTNTVLLRCRDCLAGRQRVSLLLTPLMSALLAPRRLNFQPFYVNGLMTLNIIEGHFPRVQGMGGYQHCLYPWPAP